MNKSLFFYKTFPRGNEVFASFLTSNVNGTGGDSHPCVESIRSIRALIAEQQLKFLILYN